MFGEIDKAEGDSHEEDRSKNGKIAFFHVNAEENPQAYDYQLIRRQKAAMGDAP